jgi:hypothetical protein
MENQEQGQLKTGYQVIAEQTLSEQEGAHVLGIAENTLAEIRLRNEISYRRIAKTKVLYHIDDIQEYLEHQKVNAAFVSEK